MFNFNIKNYSKDQSTIYLRQPNIFYISFLIVFILLLSGLIFYSFDIIPGILALISFALLTYREEWILNKNNSSIEYLRGALFIYKRSSYKFIDIDELELKSFIKGMKEDTKDKKLPFYFKRYYYLKLFFQNGDNYTMLTLPERDKDQLEEIYNYLK